MMRRASAASSRFSVVRCTWRPEAAWTRAALSGRRRTIWCSCLKGEVASEIRADQAKRAMAAAATYRDILGAGNFFLEMQFQGIDEQRIVNTGLLPIARDLNMPLVTTNDVHYLREGDHKPHDILLCIGTGKSVNDAQRLRYHGDQFFLKDAAQMAQIFKDYPDALANTLAIAERCNV